MTYTPQPGTTAYRILAWLEAEGKTAERNSSQIANAMGIETNGVPTLLAPALAAHLVFRRQKDRTHPRAPFWYSLTNHGVRQREFTPNPVGWMPAPKKDSTAGPPASDGAASEGTAVTPGPGQLEAAPKCEAGGDGSPARAAASTVATASAGAAVEGKGELPHQAPPDESAAQQGNLHPVADAVEPAAPAALPLQEQRREVDAQFAASLRAAMDFGDDEDSLARGAELGRRQDRLPSADLAATRRAAHAPHQPAPLAFRAARFSDGSLATERDGIVVAVYSAAEVDAIQKLLGARG